MSAKELHVYGQALSHLQMDGGWRHGGSFTKVAGLVPIMVKVRKGCERMEFSGRQ